MNSNDREYFTRRMNQEEALAACAAEPAAAVHRLLAQEYACKISRLDPPAFVRSRHPRAASQVSLASRSSP